MCACDICTCAQCVCRSMHKREPIWTCTVYSWRHPHTYYVQSVTCTYSRMFVSAYRSHVWQQVHVRQSVNVCVCVGMCMCKDIQLCACTHTYTHMGCLKVPELINSLMWHYSAGSIRYVGCPSLIAVTLLPKKDWHISSKHSMAKNFKVEEELMMPTVLQMFKSISWGDNYKLIMKLLSDSCICNFHKPLKSASDKHIVHDCIC